MISVTSLNLIESLINHANVGETAMWGDQNLTRTLPEHATDHVNGDIKWKLNQES